MPENSVEIVQTVQTVEQQVNKPSAVEEVKTIETKTIETVTTTEVVSGDGETIQSTETHEIKTDITSESEPVSNVDNNIDNNKLTEPENNEMTGENWILYRNFVDRSNQKF